VVVSPTVIPITWPNDPFRAQIEDFVKTLGGSSFWTAAVGEYGVGAMTMGTPVELTSNPFGTTTVTETDISNWVSQQITGGTLPPSDGNTIYALFFPPDVSPLFGAACQKPPYPWGRTAVFGYNDKVRVNGMPDAPYAVIPRCPSLNSLTGIDAITAAASKELVDTATNPFRGLSDDFDVWSWWFGSNRFSGLVQAGELCAPNPSSFYKPSDLAYTVQRTWSNAAAQASHDPCVPSVPGEVYFNSAPALNDPLWDRVSTTTEGGPGKIVPGVNLTFSSQTIEIDLFSDSPTEGDWTVGAVDMGFENAQLSFQFDKTTGHDGDKIQLTIGVVRPADTQFDVFLITSQLGDRTNTWPVLVRTKSPWEP
jgi:hypothetical protein